jgi:hypothetical protein
MTKKEWTDLKIGQKVKTEWPDIHDGFKMKTHYGEVVKFNFRAMQCLVKWELGSEIWQGRTQIEIY